MDNKKTCLYEKWEDIYSEPAQDLETFVNELKGHYDKCAGYDKDDKDFILKEANEHWKENL